MSSDLPVLRFTRRLVALSGVGHKAQEQVASVEGLQAAEGRRRLAERAEDLARREAALAERERALETSVAELAALIHSVQQERAEMLEASEEEIVAFSLSITEKVLQHEVEQGRYRIGEVVKSALSAVREKGALVIRVNPRDLEMTRQAVQNLRQTYGRAEITTVPDESILPASCCIETDSGKIFSEIPGRLAKIEKSLLNRNADADAV